MCTIRSTLNLEDDRSFHDAIRIRAAMQAGELLGEMERRGEIAGHGGVGYLVWGLLAYGLTKAVVDVAAWLGPRIAGVAESVLDRIMVVVAAWLLVQAHERPQGEG